MDITHLHCIVPRDWADRRKKYNVEWRKIILWGLNEARRKYLAQRIPKNNNISDKMVMKDEMRTMQ